MRGSRFVHIVATLFVFAAAVSATEGKGPRVEGGTLDFSLPDLEGNVVASTDGRFEGKVLLIDLWGTWCPPCLSEIPTFVDLQDRYAGRGFEMIGIAFEKIEDPSERRRHLASFREEQGIDYLILDGGTIDDFSSSLPAVRNARGLPIEILVSRDGRVEAARNGYGYSKKWARKLDRELQKLLGGTMNRIQDVVESYREAVNEHDIERALSYLSPDFRVLFVGTDFALSREQLREAMGWDAGANGRVVLELEKSEEGRAVYLGSESNDFLRLIGIPELKFRATFSLDEQGLIETQLYEKLPGQRSPEDAMKPAVEWASAERPDVLRRIYPDGRMIYTEEMARGWVALLEEWKRSETD